MDLQNTWKSGLKVHPVHFLNGMVHGDDDFYAEHDSGYTKVFERLQYKLRITNYPLNLILPSHLTFNWKSPFLSLCLSLSLSL
jgi:hypothetical protein